MTSVTIQSKRTSQQETSRLLNNLVEQFDVEKSLQTIIAKLTTYEAIYGMSTLQFYPQFIAGYLGDSSDFMLWATFYEAYVELMQPYMKTPSSTSQHLSSSQAYSGRKDY